jgi:hypothetical protein
VTRELRRRYLARAIVDRAAAPVVDPTGAGSGPRRFVNHWAFVRYATEKKLDLDFTTPPRRPQPVR